MQQAFDSLSSVVLYSCMREIRWYYVVFELIVLQEQATPEGCGGS